MSALEFAEAVQAELDGYDPDALRGLIERVAQITEMTEHPGWALFCDLILAETATRQRVILAGRLAPEDYNRETGWVTGALAALDAPLKLSSKLSAAREQIEEHPDDSPTGRNGNG